MTKTSQLQIRVSPAQKETLQRMARAAGKSVSAYVLSMVLPSTRLELQKRVDAFNRPGSKRRKALSDLKLFLSELSLGEFASTAASVDLEEIPPIHRNLVAATVEEVAAHQGVDPPAWTAEVSPPERPHFDPDLRSLRPHLMRVTPAAFKRRNVYLDAWGADQG